MPFIRKKVESFPWPVEIKKPSEEKPGEFEKSNFTINFKRLSRKELETFGDGDDEARSFEKVIVGWSEITDEAGKDIPFSSKLLREFIEDVDFISAIGVAYKNFYGNAREGN